MRSLADLQRDPDAPAPAAPDALPLDVQRVRTFDTPEFAGMRFLEVEAKTALNRVRGMPFGWSINPYRGCSHACSYCQTGDTPVLMGDGRTKPLANLRVGDEVYGTIPAGQGRRYVVTRVLDHWSTVKPAYRIVLEDGTTLVASGDHRFLTDRGWRHVTGAEQGRLRRPCLTTNHKLIGTGGFALPPKDTQDYQRGYLCGVIRGNGHLGFRLAPSDREALERTAAYLSDRGLACRPFLSQAEAATRLPLDAVAVSGEGNLEAIRELVAWPRAATDDWRKGFLAGSFDAEGGCPSGVLRIATTDDVIIGQITAGLRRFGFTYALERNANGCRSVRLVGGLRERLRFLHTTDPASTRKRSLEGMALERIAPLQVVEIEPLGLDVPMFDVTTGTGDFIADGVVSHNCFARPSHAYLNLSPGADFEKTIVVKTNVVEVLRRELAKPTWRGEHVAMGTNTDPYQRCEGRYKLMPGIIDALAEALTPFSILTKGTLIGRDLDRLTAAAEHVEASCALTVGMLDRDLWRASEPGTPSPQARLDTVRALNEAGVPTGVMLAPIMPGLNDDRELLAALVDACAEAGATHITPIVLHLRPVVRELFLAWLADYRPDLVERYEALYQRAYADRGYRKAVEAFVAERRRAAWRRHGRPAQASRLRGDGGAGGGARPATRNIQLPLW